MIETFLWRTLIIYSLSVFISICLLNLLQPRFPGWLRSARMSDFSSLLGCVDFACCSNSWRLHDDSCFTMFTSICSPPSSLTSPSTESMNWCQTCFHVRNSNLPLMLTNSIWPESLSPSDSLIALYFFFCFRVLLSRNFCFAAAHISLQSSPKAKGLHTWSSQTNSYKFTHSHDDISRAQLGYLLSEISCRKSRRHASSAPCQRGESADDKLIPSCSCISWSFQDTNRIAFAWTAREFCASWVCDI